MTKPNIPHIPLSTSLYHIFQFVKNPIPILQAYHEQYGLTFMMKLGGTIPSIISSDPAFAKHVLQKNHRNYRKSLVQTKHLKNFLGNGLLTSEGPYWLRQRRLIQPGFHKNRLQAIVDIMNQVTDRFLESLTEKVRYKSELDISPEMMRLTFSIVAESLFSTSVKEKELDYLSEVVTTIQEFIIKQVRLPFLNPWFKISGAFAKHKRLSEEAGEVVMKYIQERRESGEVRDDLLQMLLDSCYEDTGEGMSNQQIRDESFVLFVAGHETTANALSWIFYLLSKHPDVLEKIKAEEKEILNGHKPSFDNLPKLSYLTQVIEESMRLYPPAWITDRVALEDDEIEGVFIPKGSIIVPFIYGVHLAEHNWPEAKKFDPERFNKATQKERPGFKYLPFGGGPRLCIGNSFAMMEMQVVITRILQSFHFELVKHQTIEMEPLITLRPRYGIKLLLHPKATS